MFIHVRAKGENCNYFPLNLDLWSGEMFTVLLRVFDLG